MKLLRKMETERLKVSLVGANAVPNPTVRRDEPPEQGAGEVTINGQVRPPFTDTLLTVSLRRLAI